MKQIKLTQGKFTLVDDEDYEYLSQWKWHTLKSVNTDYAVRTINYKKPNGNRATKRIYLHRFIMNVNDGLFADHINHNGLDNRKENLRIVTNRLNCLNRITQSKYVGVQLIDNKYKAKIRIGKKQVYLGSFDSPEEAEQEYLKALIKVDERIRCI